jgi:hypothetical protein
MKWILRKVNESERARKTKRGARRRENYKLIGERRRDMSRYGGK